jgi:GntR family carbon starvation induced transcriptional regulator
MIARYDATWNVVNTMHNARDGQTLNTAIFERLREDILTGKLLPGQRLKVALLAQAQAVSLNVVREALNRLAGEGLVEVEPQLGFTVRGLSADDLIDLVRQRTLFEGVALRQSIARGDLQWQARVVAAHHLLSRTPVAVLGEPKKLNPDWLARHEDFNFAMLQACGSPRLLQIVKQLAEAAALYQRALLPAVGHSGELESEHAAMLKAALDGDADAAAAVLTSHLEQTRDLMLPLLNAQAPIPKRGPRARGRTPGVAQVAAKRAPVARSARKAAAVR